MSPGRCSGCGEQNKSCRPIRAHVRTCPRYTALLREAPEKALEPEEEYRRWVAEDRPAERTERREQLGATTDAKLAQQRARFDTPPDILE